MPLKYFHREGIVTRPPGGADVPVNSVMYLHVVKRLLFTRKVNPPGHAGVCPLFLTHLVPSSEAPGRPQCDCPGQGRPCGETLPPKGAARARCLGACVEGRCEGSSAGVSPSSPCAVLQGHPKASVIFTSHVVPESL